MSGTLEPCEAIGVRPRAVAMPGERALNFLCSAHRGTIRCSRVPVLRESKAFQGAKVTTAVTRSSEWSTVSGPSLLLTSAPEVA